MHIALAVTYHDPRGRLCDQIERVLPILSSTFDGLAIRASHAASERALALLSSTNAVVQRERSDQATEPPKLGKARREAIALALQWDAPSVMYCDGDRVLHWADQYPEELAQVTQRLSECDFTVLGRTDRAFSSHPRVQRDPETIINHVFQLVSDKSWDVTAGARGLSRRAVAAILDGCLDEDLSTDVSWPLFLRSVGGFSFGYVATEGLEFETPDRYGEEIEAAGGRREWLEQFDSDLHHWVHRLHMACGHVAAMIPYVTESSG
jgi:hypothetical protein